MNALNHSNRLSEIGMSVVNAILLAGLPVALVAILLAAF